MSGQIGSATSQIQQNIIQNSPQQNAQKSVQREVKQELQNQSAGSGTENFQKLAQDILAKRAAGEAVIQPTIERGQVVDITV